mmetsp:Transcript_14358/g.19145  ORF Transcript_14358/g.19145 Transcript_14358/m.19145 type:complete len:83 (-) Transcript_14358:48-296(-)
MSWGDRIVFQHRRRDKGALLTQHNYSPSVSDLRRTIKAKSPPQDMTSLGQKKQTPSGYDVIKAKRRPTRTWRHQDKQAPTWM